MDAVMAAALTHADGALMMIGDPEYYGRFFGFSPEYTGAWRLPGPVEARRLLAAAVGGHAVPDAPGIVGPRA
jgi:predicted N-acetyltransferase YhbS